MLGKTTIRFCGVDYILEILGDDEFNDLYDAVIDHGSDMVEQASSWSLQVFWERKAKYTENLAENSRQLDLLEKEDNRRKAVAA